MEEQEYYGQEDFRQSGAGWWIRLIGMIVYVAIILAYAWQTLELVSWLFEADNLAMKIITVFICDGCATGYALAEMFYRFRLKKSKNLVFGMWIVTFVFSTAATVIQLYLASTHRIPHSIDPTVIYIAYGLVIAAFVVNILTITVLIRMEYNASQPARHYLDDKPKRKRQIPQESQTASFAQTGTYIQEQGPTSRPMATLPSAAELEEYRRWKEQQNGPLQ